MSEYTDKLAAWFRRHADREKALPMESYMRNRFSFLGIKTPERTSITKRFWSMHGLPSGKEMLVVAQELWQLPEREFQNVAMAFLEKYGKLAVKEDIDAFERFVTTKPWWDTVDYLASHTMGDHLRKFPELIPAYTERWIESDDFWLRRTAILYQLRYKQRTDVARLFDYILRCKDEKEFFIRKAIGWALREYSKTDETAVREFVSVNELSPLSEREALKYVNRPK
ncbi:DNA alkylation repair protein [Cohnella cholangitidis]|uniref:DNA alkylation repair protein n=1 Tax=Cohnella cholangitidis TaxID=2598458 RepID=A0A7G5C4K8_9BACL|nr:DNA alkylation repair protein [Cohnella cholangitidis]QMV44142.1 DNA alkylation repair protein [Cohnella cholangitidis]